MESKSFVACHCGTWLVQLRATKRLQKLAKAFSSSSTSADHEKIIVRLIDNGENDHHQQPTQVEIILKPDDVILDQYLEILFALKQFERSSRNVFLPLLLPFASVDLQAKYDNIVARELFHIDFVRQVAVCVALETATLHDRTKDAFSTFVNCGKFEGIVPLESPPFQSMYDEEFRRHAGLEPHHPEFERINNEDCDVFSIREMAVDRLSRNVVAANGHVDHDVMKRYLPKFTLGDVSEKLSTYEKFVREYELPVVRIYKELMATSDSDGDGNETGTQSCAEFCPNVNIFYSAKSEITIELTDASVPTQ